MSDVGMLMVSGGEDPLTAYVVFVHGLKGHREGDWTKRNVEQNDIRRSNIFWPRDLLAHETWMKHVRVMSWGYDARVAHITQFTSQESIYGHASTLLEDIASQRCGENGLNRPIIFIGYSLGGLIIKQALIRSNLILLNNQDPNAGAIFSSTCGVIFLGTPHRGSFLATMGDYIRKFSTLALREGNDNILQSIKVNSIFLQQRISDFNSISQKISLVCFYEELSTPVGLAVPQAFAVMDGFNVKKVAIHSNHSNMCRFMDRSDIGYKRTSYQIRRLVHEAIPAANPRETPSQPINGYQKERESKCLQILRGSRCYERNKDRNPKRVKSTCQGILGDEKFTNWRDGKSVGLLWISAIPRYGKSVLARSLVHEELLNKDNTTICDFFFKDDDENARKVTDALCACLHQLFEKHPELIKYALPLYDQNGEALSKLDNKLWSILLEIAGDQASPNLVFAIDALNESENDEEVLIEKLVQYYNHNQMQDQSQRVTASKLKFWLLAALMNASRENFANWPEKNQKITYRYHVMARP